MEYKINIEGFDIAVSGPEAMVALLSELKRDANRGSKTEQSSAKKIVNAPVALDSEIAEKAIRFLKVMVGGGQKPTPEIMAAMGVSSPNAVGGTTKKINSLLDDLGFRKESVYKNPKKPKQPRVWYAGKDIESAIDAIEQNLIEQLV